MTRGLHGGLLPAPVSEEFALISQRLRFCKHIPRKRDRVFAATVLDVDAHRTRCGERHHHHGARMGNREMNCASRIVRLTVRATTFPASTVDNDLLRLNTGVRRQAKSNKGGAEDESVAVGRALKSPRSRTFYRVHKCEVRRPEPLDIGRQHCATTRGRACCGCAPLVWLSSCHEKNFRVRSSLDAARRSTRASA
jgi:hypothetical protein